MSKLFGFIGLAELLALGSSLAYSVTFISLRQGLRSGSPLVGVLIMDAVVGVFGLVVAQTQGLLLSSSLVPLLWFALAGCVGQGLGQICSLTGIERMGVSRAAPIQGSSPIWAVLLAMAVLGERPGTVVWAGTLAIVTGVAMLSRSGSVGTVSGEKVRFRDGLIFPIAASIMFAVMPILAKLGFAHQSTPMVAVGVAFSSGALLLAVVIRLGRGDRVRADRRALSWFCLAGVSTAAAASMFWSSLTLGDVSVLMPLSRLAPLWAVLWSFLFLGHIERVTGRVFFAAALIVAGGGVIMTSR